MSAPATSSLGYAVEDIPSFSLVARQAKDVREGIASFYAQVRRVFDLGRLGRDQEGLAILDSIAALPPKSKELNNLFSTLDSIIGQLPYEVIQKLFPSEMDRALLQYGNHWAKTKTWENAREEEAASWISHKLNLSAWHASFIRLSWNHMARIANNIRELQVVNTKGDVLPEFSWRLDTSSTFNPKGFSRFHRKFLDAELGLFLYHDNTPVAVVGFNIRAGSFLKKGNKRPIITIHQIQLLQAKGNRCMYQLGANYFEAILQQLCAQFKFPVLLIKGKAVVENVYKSYDANAHTKKAEFMTHAPRVQALYDQPMSKVFRKVELLDFHLLSLSA